MGISFDFSKHLLLFHAADLFSIKFPSVVFLSFILVLDTCWGFESTSFSALLGRGLWPSLGFPIVVYINNVVHFN